MNVDISMNFDHPDHKMRPKFDISVSVISEFYCRFYWKFESIKSNEFSGFTCDVVYNDRYARIQIAIVTSSTP